MNDTPDAVRIPSVEYFVKRDDWNAAVIHSRENPTHILGPYYDDDGQMQMECTCGFDTGAVPAAAAGPGTDGGDT